MLRGLIASHSRLTCVVIHILVWSSSLTGVSTHAEVETTIQHPAIFVLLIQSLPSSLLTSGRNTCLGSFI